MNKVCPCKNCTSDAQPGQETVRHSGCHDRCKPYQEWRIEERRKNLMEIKRRKECMIGRPVPKYQRRILK